LPLADYFILGCSCRSYGLANPASPKNFTPAFYTYCANASDTKKGSAPRFDLTKQMSPQGQTVDVGMGDAK
jgi:hypothetical protein